MPRPQIADVGLIGVSKRQVTDISCIACTACLDICKEGALTVTDENPVLDESKCLCCGQCGEICPTGPLKPLKEEKSGYRILIGGKLGSHPKLARELNGFYWKESAMQVIEQCLDSYQAHCHEGERFGAIIEREKFSTQKPQEKQKKDLLT